MVDQERLVRCFTELTAIDAPSFGERAMADELIRRFGALGISVWEDDAGGKIGGSAGNLIARLAGDADLEPLIFSAHLDTVEPSAGKKAVVYPDGRITSDGSTVLGADDGTGLAAILEAVTVILERGLRHHPLELVFPVAEEPYTRGSRAMDISEITAKEAYVLDMSGPVGAAALTAPTILYFKITVRGRAAHAGMAPETGIHAIKIATQIINKLKMGQVDPMTTVNVGTIHGGLATNIVPETCVLEGEIRGFDHAATIRYAREIQTLAQNTAMGGEVVMEHEIRTRAYAESEISSVTARFVRACECIGIPPIFGKTFGGSDNNTFQACGIHGIVVANAMEQMHSTEEYTTVEGLTKVAELTLALMTDGQ